MTARRGEVVRQAVLAAALAELAERGYADLSVEHVAVRAGVHKTTVYRRWPDRESLLTDAVLEQAAGDFAIPDTGDVDGDLAVGLRALVAWLTGPTGRPLVAMLRSDAGRLPAVVQARRRFLAARAQVLARRLASAVEAGQVPAGTRPDVFLATLVAPVYLDLLVLDRDPAPEDCDRWAKVALAAARAHLLA
ncbi:TetR/AcrR family transcriptional regulator [Kineosporia sp. R_H_3]|uniref:TetR/AcrR family transcriptional regulator n=1 Tax=Kineosporia sp. R_H_3 TaxID=1961848 RepID=UPI000B4BB000|nr:TetR/AcrR family transcriptional regulator [Kineosporia sp. R_H_3]